MVTQLNRWVRGLIILSPLIFSGVDRGAFGQSGPKVFDVNFGLHNIYTNLTPLKPFRGRILSHKGIEAGHLQVNRTYRLVPSENSWLRLKHGLTLNIVGDTQFPFLFFSNSAEVEVFRRSPGKLSLGIESNIQLSKWFFPKSNSRYPAICGTLFAVVRPVKQLRNIRLKYRYDISPFLYRYFELQDINTSWTYQKGISIEYTIPQKKSRLRLANE